MTVSRPSPRVRRSPIRLAADPVAGHHPPVRARARGLRRNRNSRTSSGPRPLLALTTTRSRAAFDDVVARFDGRHRDLDRHVPSARRRARRPPRPGPRSCPRPAGCCSARRSRASTPSRAPRSATPAWSPHPDQTGVPPGSLRFVMSVRAIGEGHRSSIGFRTGTVDASGDVDFDAAPAFATTGTTEAALFEAGRVPRRARRLRRRRGGRRLRARRPRTTVHRSRAGGAAAPPRRSSVATRSTARRTDRARSARSPSGPTASASPTETLAQRAGPLAGHERREPRAWRTPASCGSSTTTARSPTTPPTRPTTARTSPSSCSRPPTSSRFTSSPIAGPAAANKGLALFPRRIGGRFAALSRSDRESNTVAYSDNPRRWARPRCRARRRPVRGRSLQLGNCGSPIETDAGWLVLTHGVGPDAHLQHRRDPARPRRPDAASSASSATRCSAPPPTSRTATCPMSSTPAARSSTPARWSCPTASATRHRPRHRRARSTARRPHRRTTVKGPSAGGGHGTVTVTARRSGA